MTGYYQYAPERRHLCRAIRAVLVLAALVVVPFAGVVYAQGNPIPSEIKDIQMGCSTNTVIEKIKTSGTYTNTPVDKENRTIILWQHPSLPYYKDIGFQFTEKDRLYLIRFTLNDAARADYHSLKKTVFKDYDFSWDQPWKQILPDREMLLYGPEKGQELFFIEFTDRKSHEKSFELFNRSISATDRPEPLAMSKKPDKQPEPSADKPMDRGAKPPTADKADPTPTPASPAEAPSAAPIVETAAPAQPAAVPAEAQKPAEVQKPAAPEKLETPQDPTSGQKAVGE
jgi:hypothetical protein